MIELNKKHTYIFKVKCDSCSRAFIIKLELNAFIEPEWLIKSVPIKNICEKCNIISQAKRMIKKLKKTRKCTEGYKER